MGAPVARVALVPRSAVEMKPEPAPPPPPPVRVSPPAPRRPKQVIAKPEKPARAPSRWTGHEVATLLYMAASGRTAKQIAVAIGKNPGAVRSRAYYNGVRLAKDPVRGPDHAGERKRLTPESGAANPAAPIRLIIARVADELGLTAAAIISESRRAPIVAARQLAMWRAARDTSASFARIGHAFGGRDHTTVHYAVAKINRQFGTMVRPPRADRSKRFRGGAQA